MPETIPTDAERVAKTRESRRLFIKGDAAIVHELAEKGDYTAAYDRARILVRLLAAEVGAE